MSRWLRLLAAPSPHFKAEQGPQFGMGDTAPGSGRGLRVHPNKNNGGDPEDGLITGRRAGPAPPPL